MQLRPSGQQLKDIQRKYLHKRIGELREFWPSRHQNNEFVKWLIEDIRRTKNLMRIVLKMTDDEMGV